MITAVNLNSGNIGKRNNGTPEATPKDDQGVLSSTKQQAKEYSNSIFPNHNEEDGAPGLIYAIANSVNIVQDRITRSRLAGHSPGDGEVENDVAS